MEESLTRFWYPVRFRASSTRCEYAPGASGGGRSRLWRWPEGRDAPKPGGGRVLRAPAPGGNSHPPRGVPRAGIAGESLPPPPTRPSRPGLRFIGEAAVAMIGLAAGSELTLDALRRGRMALARLASGAIVFPLLAVSLVVLSVSSWFPLTRHQPLGDALVVALVLGTLAAASSPAVTMAMMSELDAHGPVARALLGITVVKDVAVALLFALVLALGKALTSAGALNVAVAGTAILQLLGSAAVGTLLGYALGQYLGLVRRDSAVFLVATAFVAAEVVRLTHLETLIIALAAGFYLENFAPVEGERLRRELKRGSLPVYVAFFALTGAGLRVGVLADLWPWILLLVGLRLVGLRYGLLWAGRHSSVTPVLARHGWLGLLSQAGGGAGVAHPPPAAVPGGGAALGRLGVAVVWGPEGAGAPRLPPAPRGPR